MTRPNHEVERVLALHEGGFNHCEIARATGIARSTLRAWIKSPPEHRPNRQSTSCHRCDRRIERPESDYVYLLGLYLGDGTISPGPKDVYRMRIVQDLHYPVLIELCRAALEAVMPLNKVGFVPKEGCVELSSFSKHWPHLFPQTGPGPKWTRSIQLAGWQQTLVDRHPKALMRGLIHSDGCRDLNRIVTAGKTKVHPGTRSLRSRQTSCAYSPTRVTHSACIGRE